MSDHASRRRSLFVFAIFTLTLATTLALGLGTVAAQTPAEPDIKCLSEDNPTHYQTDSGLLVSEDDDEGTIDEFFFPDDDTVRFAYEEGAVNLTGEADAELRLDSGTGAVTCLANVDTDSGTVEISPDNANDVELEGEFDGFAFRDVVTDRTEATTDIAYDGTPGAVTVEMGPDDGTEIEAIDVSDGSTVDSAEVSDGAVTFGSLPAGEYEVSVQLAVVADDIDASVTVDEAVTDGEDEVGFTITLETEDGDPVEDATVEVDDAKDVDALDGIDSGDEKQTDADGKATFTATSTDSGEFTVQFSEENAGSDTATATFEVEAQATSSPSPASFDVTIDAVTDNVTEGEMITVDATIQNNGERSDTQEVTLSNFGGGVVDTTEVSLDGGDQTSVSLQWLTPVGDAGAGSLTVASADDTATTDTVVVLEKPDPTFFELAALEVPADVEAGEPFDVSVVVTNTGDLATEQPIVLSIDGAGVEESRLLTLQGSDTATITFEDVSIDGPGVYTVDLSTDNVSISGSVAVNAEDEAGDQEGDSVDADDLPGFGVVLTLFVLLATGLFAVRRRK